MILLQLFYSVGMTAGYQEFSSTSKRGREPAQHKFEAFYHCAITSNPIGAHTDTDHTVPYGTALLRGAVPGTSRQATIVLSLRDISQQALAKAEARPYQPPKFLSSPLPALRRPHPTSPLRAASNGCRESSMPDKVNSDSLTEMIYESPRDRLY